MNKVIVVILSQHHPWYLYQILHSAYKSPISPDLAKIDYNFYHFKYCSILFNVFSWCHTSCNCLSIQRDQLKQLCRIEVISLLMLCVLSIIGLLKAMIEISNANILAEYFECYYSVDCLMLPTLIGIIVAVEMVSFLKRKIV